MDTDDDLAHQPQHVAGVGMMYYPRTSYTYKVRAYSPEGELSQEVLYEGTEGGFMQWALTVLADPNWRPEYRLSVETEMLNIRSRMP